MLMRSSAPADPSFPSLESALDAKFLADALAHDLAAAGHELREPSVTIDRVRLKNGRKALLGLRLRGRSKAGTIVDQPLMLTLWPGGDKRHLPIVAGIAASTPQFGPPALDCAALGGSAWFFPNDRKVGGIARLLDQAHARHANVEIVHYVPEQGCTIRAQGASGTAFGKARSDDRCAIAAQVARHAATVSGVRLAPLLLHEPEHRIMWQAEVAGAPLQARQIAAEPHTWTPRIAMAIAAFHSLPTQGVPGPITATHRYAELVRRGAVITSTYPSLNAVLDRVLRRLDETMPAFGKIVLGHGDVHHGNLLWDGNSFALIDCDTVRLAAAEHDHAGYAAALGQRMLVDGASIDEAWKLVEFSLHGSLAAEKLNPGALAWHLAASLLGERLYRCATRLKANHPEIPRQLLDLAARAALQAGAHHG